MKPITDVAAGLGLADDHLVPYGRYKAKVHLAALEARRSAPNGKLVVVSSITPTPPGDGKTTVTIGLGQGLTRIGRRAVVALREPSIGPCLGIKGGGTGGGRAQVVPGTTSTCTSRGTSTPSRARTTSSPRASTTTCSTTTCSASTRGRSSSGAPWT